MAIQIIAAVWSLISYLFIILIILLRTSTNVFFNRKLLLSVTITDSIVVQNGIR